MLLKIKIVEGESLKTISEDNKVRYSNIHKTYYYVNEYLGPDNNRQYLWAYDKTITIHDDQVLLLLDELKTHNIAWQLNFPTSKAQTADNFKLIDLKLYKILFNGNIYHIEKDINKLEPVI